MEPKRAGFHIMSAHSFDSTTGTFEQDVLERSKTVPVLVDFWAPWCAPCRVLKPILEKLAVEFAGRFALAKVNTDENPEIATRYGVRGIPNVKAFVDGALVDEFTGALPESGVRGFLEGLVPSESEKLRRAAAAALAQGDVSNAEAALREAIALDPANLDARVDFAALLLARDDYAGAEAQLGEVPDDVRDDRSNAIAAKVALWKRGQSLPDLATLEAQVDARPEDLDARLGYADRLAAAGRFRAALDQLIEVVRRDRGERRERARKTVLALFGLAADQPDLVGEYRRKLAGALY
jgi:putative thioredoxin